jgi:metallophosphoesterase (TIGR03767 family)
MQAKRVPLSASWRTTLPSRLPHWSALRPTGACSRWIALVAALWVSPGAHAAMGQPTTEDSTVIGDEGAAYSDLRPAPGWPRQTREELATAEPSRVGRRRSLIYFGAIDEIHYTDEESPQRVEFLDFDDTPLTEAWKPHEALTAFAIDAVIRGVNAFAGRSPIHAVGGRARMALVLTTGDNADNQQRNEVQTYVRLLEGGTVNPNSGVESDLPCPAGPIPAGEAGRYTGVQDYNDYFETDGFYDPNRPVGRFAAWPNWPGLMDRAQKPFQAEGLRVPSYVALGNHDRLVQGNQWQNAAFETVATGCAKIYAPTIGQPTPTALLTSPERVFAVPPDPSRDSMKYPEFRALHATGRQPDAHGFAFVDPQELSASNGAASYYAFSPEPGLRFISINTVSEGGVTGPSAEGNLDDPQFQWLADELERAREREQLVVVFAHHPIGSMTSQVPDEAAPPCLPVDPNDGCDLDPRPSGPIHTGDDVRDLFLANPNVIAFVAGHTDQLKITPFARPDGSGGFWQIESGSASKWPNGARLLEVMDNRDGTLSVFGTMVDMAADIDTPAPGTQAATFTDSQLASIGRALAFNDFQQRPIQVLGDLKDRNVELLLPDPRRPRKTPGGGAAGALRADARSAACARLGNAGVCHSPLRAGRPPSGYSGARLPSGQVSGVGTWMSSRRPSQWVRVAHRALSWTCYEGRC